jgi:putative ABC transport system permease protein
MFARLLYQSFLRQRRRKLMAGIAVALGVGVATAMIAVATDIGDKINRELRTFGANIVIYPQEDTLDVEVGGRNLKPASDGAFLKESDLPKIKGTFWRHNIVGFAPLLPVTVKTAAGDVQLVGTYFDKKMKIGVDEFTTGMKLTNPWWKVTGAWPKDDSRDVLVGETLAQKLGVKPGDNLDVQTTPPKSKEGSDGAPASFHVVGVVSADQATNNQIVAPLAVAQDILGRPGVVRRVLLSAMTKPEDELARRNPDTMSPEMRDRWYCSPYANSIAFQMEEALPGAKAEQIRQVAQNEGTVLSRISGLMLLLAAAALAASALAVSAAMATTIFERRGEIGLMKAMGAGKVMVAAMFMAEAAVLAILGGAVGFGIGALLAQQMGRVVFASTIAIQPVLLPIVLAIALAVTFAGSAASIRRAMKLEPAIVLRGDA